MRVPISGIVTGFRIRQNKDSDFGVIDIVQPGTKELDSSLIFVYVQTTDHLEYLLREYFHGQLRWIDTFCAEIPQGREKVWLLQDIYSFSSEQIEVIK